MPGAQRDHDAKAQVLQPLPQRIAPAERGHSAVELDAEVYEHIALLQAQPAAQSYWLAYVTADARLRREFGFAEQGQSPFCPVDAFPMAPAAADDLLSDL